ncbi:MAG: hypothetical protein B7Z37_26045 [Verrucomicrobia bacterium 12-59-8]|nr:MAG: hypothetical protein B7Z37_26045 [Verrucomicrobia bacterium 12-59-8]
MPESAELDNAPHLPRRNWASIVLVLFVQAMNSFSDNFVKMLLIALSIIIAKDSWVGRHMELWLGAIFSLPYMIFAPLAGYWSDRFSKRKVIVWMQVMQIICFVWLALALWMKRVPGSLEICLLGFFVLAVQAAVLSPAKMGIMKELAGSRRLGRVSGWLQVTMLAGILGGMWAGGIWYGTEYERTGDAWMSALWPLIIISLMGIVELIAAICVQTTPSHPEVSWRKGMALEHFESLKIVFRRRSIRLAALGVTYFWFISNALSFILVTLTKELHPDTGHGDGPMELAKVAGILGIGVISGSFFASHISRNRIEMGLIPLGGFGLVVGLLWSGLATLGSSWMYAGIILTGAAGGCFMVPLYAFAQDKAEKQEKARIHAGMNLMDCLGTLVAVAIVGLMKVMNLSSSTQFLLLAIPTFFAAVYIMRLLPQDLVRFLMLAAVRFTYKVKSVHMERIPATGGVLLLPNHVSYVDALIVGSASRRPVRFVMWDTLYHFRHTRQGCHPSRRRCAQGGGDRLPLPRRPDHPPWHGQRTAQRLRTDGTPGRCPGGARLPRWSLRQHLLLSGRQVLHQTPQAPALPRGSAFRRTSRRTRRYRRSRPPRHARPQRRSLPQTQKLAPRRSRRPRPLRQRPPPRRNRMASPRRCLPQPRPPRQHHPPHRQSPHPGHPRHQVHRPPHRSPRHPHRRLLHPQYAKSAYRPGAPRLLPRQRSVSAAPDHRHARLH